ncbi:MAG TPA: hypothetical protein VGI15_09060, partial [Candidatus Cybelea sp.]
MPNLAFGAACRHLFRHLREPSELRRNPLAAAFFTHDLKGAARVRSDAVVAGAIRDAIRRCADRCLQSDRLEDEEHAVRQHRIIVEGDLDGTPRTVLADTLGLSTRHYTRLQHGIRRRIAVLLSSEMRQRENAFGRASLSIRMLPPLHQISVLVATGSTNAAAEQLHTITRQSGDDRLVAS